MGYFLYYIYKHNIVDKKKYLLIYMSNSALLKPNDPDYPKPNSEIPLIEPTAYEKNKQFSSSGYGVYTVLNHPDKVIKIMNLADAPPDAMYEEDPWNELNMSYRAGIIGVGPPHKNNKKIECV